MYVLTDDLARRRILYPRPLPTLPDILVIDVPGRFAHPSLPLGRYYPIIIETVEELAEVEAYLHATRPGPLRPDLLDRRRSAIVVERIVFAAYAPPSDSWPHLLLCHWPPLYPALTADPELFARGAYTTEAFDTLGELASASGTLLDMLGGSNQVAVTLIPAMAGVQGEA
jgi:hypothetical protein